MLSLSKNEGLGLSGTALLLQVASWCSDRTAQLLHGGHLDDGSLPLDAAWLLSATLQTEAVLLPSDVVLDAVMKPAQLLLIGQHICCS